MSNKRPLFIPKTPPDVSRDESVPEMIVACMGQDKNNNFYGWLVMNNALQSSIEAHKYVNLAFVDIDKKIYIVLSASDAFKSTNYKLYDFDCIIKNKELFRELSEMFKLSFKENKTYHFNNVRFITDNDGNNIGVVDMDDFYATPYTFMPYSSRLEDEWEVYYDEPNDKQTY